MRDSNHQALRASLLAAVFVLLLASSSAANDWPSFRGLRAAGVADGTNPPVQWDVGNGENVAWKTSTSGMAHSSPIVLGDRIYLTTAVSSQGETAFQFPLAGEMDRRTDLSAHQFRLLAIDLKTGSVVWDQLALEAELRVARHPPVSASINNDSERAAISAPRPSPPTDGSISPTRTDRYSWSAPAATSSSSLPTRWARSPWPRRRSRRG